MNLISENYAGDIIQMLLHNVLLHNIEVSIAIMAKMNMQVVIYRATWHDFHPSSQNFSLKRFLTFFPKKIHSKKIIILS